jgi:hypothetical protein
MLKSEKTQKYVLLPTVLTLFDGAAAGAASTGAATSTGTTDGSTGQSTVGTAPKAGKGTDKPKVIYGKVDDTNVPASVQTTPGQKQKEGQKDKQDADIGSQYANLSPEEKEKTYYKLVRGEFKDLFAAHTQKIIDERFKQTKILESRLNEVQPVIDLLMTRYGAKSIADLNAKLEDEVLPDLAEQAGMSPEAYKRQLQLENENKKLRAEKEMEAINQKVAQWQQEAAIMRGTPEKPGKYPDFDLRAAAEHPKYGPKFLKLLESGIEVEAAYLAAFHEELIGKAQAETAKRAESATLEAIRAGTMRPPEVGAKPSSGVIHKSSVRQLTAEDRREIAERVKRGEKIRF